MSGVKWSAEDEGYLRGAWGREGLLELATRFGRSAASVKHHAHEMGLPSQTRARWQAERGEAIPTPEDAAHKLFAAALDAWGRIEPILSKPVPERKMKWGLHEACLQLSDAHVGLKVDPKLTGGFGGYDLEVAARRCRILRDSIIEITQIHQEAMTIKRLNVFELGDDLEGAGQIYPSQPFFMDANLAQQWLAFGEMMVTFLRTLLQAYQVIKVFKVHGNHGRFTKKRDEGHPQDNIELLLWHYIAARLQNEPRIRFAISPCYFMLVRRMDRLFYLSHGEETLPWSPYAARGAFNVKLRLNSLFQEKIDYMLAAHHHVPLEIERELEGAILYNGSWVGPTEWGLRRFKEASLPSQNFFLVHPRIGMRAFDKIRMADAAGVRNVKVDEE